MCVCVCVCVCVRVCVCMYVNVCVCVCELVQFAYIMECTCDIFSLHCESSFITACALSFASLSACSKISRCSASVRASQRRFDK